MPQLRQLRQGDGRFAKRGMKRPRRDLTGHRFGRLRVIAFAGYKPKRGGHWHCRCDCGTHRTVRGQSLVRHVTTSCGCFQKAQTRKSATHHGYHHTNLYRRWAAMLNRCRNPRTKGYARYGGRGITVCERWLDFANFLADMGEPPPAMTLERRDNDGPYSPDNCYWASRRVQGNNTGSNVFITWQAQRHTLTEWARRLGVPDSRLRGRLRAGWSLDEAFTRPAQVNGVLRAREKTL